MCDRGGNATDIPHIKGPLRLRFQLRHVLKMEEMGHPRLTQPQAHRRPPQHRERLQCENNNALSFIKLVRRRLLHPLLSHISPLHSRDQEDSHLMSERGNISRSFGPTQPTSCRVSSIPSSGRVVFFKKVIPRHRSGMQLSHWGLSTRRWRRLRNRLRDRQMTVKIASTQRPPTTVSRYNNTAKRSQGYEKQYKIMKHDRNEQY